MGIVNRLFGKGGNRPEEKEKGPIHLAFVLLSEAQLPREEEIASAFRDFAEAGEDIQVDADESGCTARDQVLTFKLNTEESCFVALMPAPVPNGEADEGAQFSVSSFGSEWKLSPHCAHLVVTLIGASDSSLLDQISRFTSLVAAVTKVSPAVGVYWGNAGATHSPEFFISVASEQGVVPRIMLWSGISIAREKDGRLSLLSLGMKQLNLPDLLLVAGESSGEVALETMFDLLAYVAQRGEALRDGDTVGRTAEEKLPVRYVRSPLDSSTKVWRVELP